MNRARVDDLGLLPNDAMRARRIPQAIVALWGWDAVVATVAVWPLVALVEAAYGTHPRGDAALFTAGALPLLDLFAHSESARAPLIIHMSLTLTFAFVLGLIPSTCVLVAIAFASRDGKPPRAKAALLRAYESFRPMAVLLLVATLLEIAIGVGAFFAAGWASGRLSTAFSGRLGEAHAEQVGWALGAVILLAAFIVHVAHDVARAAVVRFRVGAWRGLAIAAATMRAESTVALCWSWAWRAGCACLPVLFGALVAQQTGGRGGLTLLAVAVIHQAVILSRAALRTSWLAKAMRAVDTPLPG